jgi:SsrA-binding protein
MHKASNINVKNRRAFFDYELSDFLVAGIQLFGTEIKAIREGKAGLSDSYCLFINGELWVKNMHIAEYSFGTYANHEARRDRKLLVTKRELAKLVRATKETGLTIIPTKLFVNEKGLAKLEIAVARGKKSYDKRQTLKEKEDKRQMDRAYKSKIDR